MWLFVPFVAVPLIEIALFIQIGGWLTLWPTLALVVGTSAFGVWLVRRSGARALAEVARSMEEMRDPAKPLAHGAMILFAGLLLILPGFLTDTAGLVLLAPGVRGWIMRAVARRAAARCGGGEVIDGDYTDVTPRGDPALGRRESGSAGASGWTRH